MSEEGHSSPERDGTNFYGTASDPWFIHNSAPITWLCICKYTPLKHYFPKDLAQLIAKRLYDASIDFSDTLYPWDDTFLFFNPANPREGPLWLKCAGGRGEEVDFPCTICLRPWVSWEIGCPKHGPFQGICNSCKSEGCLNLDEESGVCRDCIKILN